MTQRDDTKEQAAADEDLFEDTKASCKKKLESGLSVRDCGHQSL